MATIRIQRLQNLIKSRIASVLLKDLADPRMGLITITKVELAKDLSLAKILWSTLSEGVERRLTEHALKDATPYLQRSVAEVLETRVAPKLTFVFDPSLERMERISKVIGGALAEDQAARRERGEEEPTDPEVEASVEEDDAEPGPAGRAKG